MRTLAAPLLLTLGLALALPAPGQWMWRDAQGRAVFSDRAPPPDIPEKNIQSRPSGAVPRAAPPVAPAATPAATPASAPPLALPRQDKELEQRRQQAEAEEAAKQKAAQESNAKARAENCARARQAKASFDSGLRIARMNAQGEREFLDDATRASETRRLQDIIAKDCSPAQ